MRPGTAPVTIPSSARLDRNPLPPFFSPRSTRRSPTSQDSLPGIAFYKSSRSGDSPSGFMNQYPGLKYCLPCSLDFLSSSGSPRFGFSRSPSRLSSQDDLDDPDCSCPFDFDVDKSELQYREKVTGCSGWSSSSNAEDSTAITARLKHMASMSGVQGEGSVSGIESEFSMALSTSDAIEELRKYKQLKDLLLCKSKSVGEATPVH
ncbi:unnamed protein product [Eruca vesicaria subsp. sativa]|uniref:Uncharacterized protein n=1 Tax=Eruca vesicaria subsp. sativa TaxID=29727 RepID=A0ABC8LL38_ERUVS|nr:unnamed protein product [Eruca vesicaria subsp. sativa]